MAVGHQHGYTGVWSAIRKIYQQEGFRGLYRGSVLSMGRSIVGSGANLSSFSIMREYLNVEQKWKDVCTFCPTHNLLLGSLSGYGLWFDIWSGIMPLYEPNRRSQDQIL